MHGGQVSLPPRPFVWAAGVVISIAVATPAIGAMSDFVGDWRPANPKTGGVTHLQLRHDRGQLFLHAWGSCHPTDCDWGEVAVQPFVPKIDMPVEENTSAFVAEYDQKFAKTMIIGKINSDGFLDAKIFTMFLDNSNRNDYLVDWKFARQ